MGLFELVKHFVYGFCLTAFLGHEREAVLSIFPTLCWIACCSQIAYGR